MERVREQAPTAQPTAEAQVEEVVAPSPHQEPDTSGDVPVVPSAAPTRQSFRSKHKRCGSTENDL